MGPVMLMMRDAPLHNPVGFLCGAGGIGESKWLEHLRGRVMHTDKAPVPSCCTSALTECICPIKMHGHN